MVKPFSSRLLLEMLTTLQKNWHREPIECADMVVGCGTVQWLNEFEAYITVARASSSRIGASVIYNDPPLLLNAIHWQQLANHQQSSFPLEFSFTGNTETVNLY